VPFEFRKSEVIPDIVVIEPRVFQDDRGWFMETFAASDFVANGIRPAFVQDNHSRSNSRGVIRGLHYQKHPSAQGKLVRCIIGAIFDVAVDIRKGSPTYGKWVGVELSAENHRMLWIPTGFAHGLCTLTEHSEVVYKVTAGYNPELDRVIRWNDPALAITWPTSDPIASHRDQQAPLLQEADNDFTWQDAGQSSPK
jgi:dTDP-4-dehydrorhamnose 3,5-epimerase